MISLSSIETEAQKLIGRLPESDRSELQTALVELCKTHWHTLRGLRPVTPLKQALWSVIPPLADLFIDLYAAGDARLLNILGDHNPSRGLALLVLAAIEQGDEMGVHIAHEPMMLFDTTPPPASWLEGVTALLRGKLEAPHPHRHDRHHPLWKALNVITQHTRRPDLPAMLAVIDLLTKPQDQITVSADTALEQLRHAINETGIRFSHIQDNSIYFEQHGHAHKPVRIRHLGELLLEIRQQWLR